MNSFNTLHSNINSKSVTKYYRVVSAGLLAMNGTVVRNISGFSANGISPGFYLYNPTDLTQTPLAIYNNPPPPPPFGRSYNVLTINRTTGVTSTTTYDVYGGTGATPLTNYLNSLTSSVIVAIATWDEPKYDGGSNPLPAGLVTAIKRCGASSNFPSFINLRGAYVLVGIPDIGEGKGIQRYVGGPFDLGDPNAAIDLRFTVSADKYRYINYTNNLVLWYTFDSISGTTVYDNMGNYNATIQSATIDTLDKTVGTASAAFAGNNTGNEPYIDVADLPASLTDANALSFSFWFRSTSSTTTWGRIFDFGNAAASDNIIAFIETGNFGLSVYDGTTAGNNYGFIINANDNVWRHCVWVMSKISNIVTWNIYINGTLSVTKTTGVYFPRSVVRTINYIGKSNWDGDPGYNGNIDDFRIYKEALTQESVSILFAYNRTNYTDNLTLWYKFDTNTISGNTVIDSTGNYNGTLINGATIDTTNKKVGNASLFLDVPATNTRANYRYVQVPTLPSSMITNNVISFTFWFRATSNTVNGGRIFDFANADFSDGICAYITNGNLGVALLATQNPNVFANVIDNVWRHCVWVLDNTTWRVYINGVMVQTQSTTAPVVTTRTVNSIGLSAYTFSSYYNGNVDDFRVYKEALTQDKIDIIYNNYR